MSAEPISGSGGIDDAGAVIPITLDYLAGRSIWVAWQAELREGAEPGFAPTKVPYRARGHLGRGSSTEPGDWGTLAEALARAEALPKPYGDGGIGVVLTSLGDGTRLCGVDLDTCHDPATGNLAAWARGVVERFGSYAEVSPSKRGVKVFFRLRPEDRDEIIAEILTVRPDGDGTGIKWARGGGGHPPAIELFLAARYFTVTQERLQATPDELRIVDAKTVHWLLREAGPAFVGNGHDREAGSPRDNSRSGAAWRIGVAMRAQGKTYEDFSAAVRDDPETAGWYAEKGIANGKRELKRIWDKATAGPHLVNPHAPYDIAVLFRRDRYAVGDSLVLYHHRGEFFSWDGICYPKIPEDEIRAQLYAFLNDCLAPGKDGPMPLKPNTTMVNNVTDALRAATILSNVEPPSWLEQVPDLDPTEIVACANGLIHLPTGNLLPHTSAFFSHNALDFALDPAATCPLWFDFLRELWGDDNEAIGTLQDIFGYCLGADTHQQKAFLLIGPKRSGKGTIARVLRAVVGAANAVAPTLAGLGTQFGLQPLIDKRVAIISDARLGGRADQAIIAERLLSISGEDAITIDRKYLGAWTGNLGVRFLILTNELPRLADASGALAARFIVLILKESFYGREDPGLTEKLLTELPGVLNWSIAGWCHLQQRGYFVQPRSAMETVNKLEDLGSPIGAFIRGCCEFGAVYDILPDHLFEGWEVWCSEQRIKAGGKQIFGRDMHAVLPRLKMRQPRVDGDRERRYVGIRLNSEWEAKRARAAEAKEDAKLVKANLAKLGPLFFEIPM